MLLQDLCLLGVGVGGVLKSHSLSAVPTVKKIEPTCLCPAQRSNPLPPDTGEFAFLEICGERPDTNLKLNVFNDPESARLHARPYPAWAYFRSTAG